jgi:uncharacterized protein (TIGR03437 family)
MGRRRKIFIGKTIAILAVVPILIWALEAGPEPGKSGAPGESTCAEAGCHVGTPLNGGGGSVRIDAGGTNYTPGVKQRIIVTINDPTQRRWGFQLTARLASNTRTRAGTLAPIDANTFVTCATASLVEVIPCPANPVLQYIEHTLAGNRITAVGAGGSYQFDWTPPATDVGDVILYAAGNAANGNALETGDHIYTTNLRLSPGSGGGNKPTISSVVNGGSFQSGISGNMYVSILGSNLGTSDARTWDSDIRGNQLPITVAGTSVKINNGDAFIYYVSPTIVNVLSPIDTATGPVSVQLTYNGTVSDTVTAQMAQFSPAFFIFNNDKYIASRHADFSLLGPTGLFPGLTTPAKPSEVILLYGTGFGPTNPAAPDGVLVTTALPAANDVIMQIGGVTVTPQFVGLVASGEFQINVQVPDSAPNGDVPVVATVGGVSSPANTFISVQR